MKIFLMFFVFQLSLFAQTKVQIIHDRPTAVVKNQEKIISVNILGFENVDSVYLNYRFSEDDNWFKTEMLPNNGKIEAKLPVADSKSTYLLYFIEAFGNDGNIITSFASEKKPQELEIVDNGNIVNVDTIDVSSEKYFSELVDIFDINKIEVVGVSKKKETVNQVPMQVYVIQKQELDRWGVRNLYETLQRVPGFSFYNIDYYGQYGLMSRGLYSIWRFGYSIELMKFPDFGHNIFAPKFFKSIEVARGPGGLTWGSSAEAGLFNMTIRDDLNGAEASIEYGNFNRMSTDLLYGKKIGDGVKDNFFVGFHLEQQDFDTQKDVFGTTEDWKENGLNPSYSVIAKIDYKPFKAVFYREHADHIAPRIWFAGDLSEELAEAIKEKTGENIHDQLISTLFRLEYHFLSYESKNEKNVLSYANAYIYGNYFRKQWWTEAVAIDTQGKEETGINVELGFFDKMLEMNFGGEFWGKDISNDPSMTTTWAHDEHGITWYDTALDDKTFSYRNFFTQINLHLFENMVTLVAGSRLDWEENGVPDPIIINAYRLGAIYQPTEVLTFKLLYNGTERRPAFNEREGSPEPEQLQSFDLVSIYNYKDKFSMNVGIAYQILSNTIVKDNTSTELNKFINSGGSDTIALEWAFQAKPIKPMLIYFNGSYNRSKAVKDSILAHNKDDDLLFVPNFTSIFGIEYSIFNTVLVNVGIRTISAIPYKDLNGDERKSDFTYFIDSTISTKYFSNLVKFSLSALNLTNNQPKLPAFGEHSENKNGTLLPEGFRIMGRLTFLLP